MKIKCINKKDADKLEADLRFLYFLDDEKPFIKWTRKGNVFRVQNEMTDVFGKPGYVRYYLSKEKSRIFSN